ncbi:UDP-N-acetylmuramoyl-L-alanyl-D-glutamate--2,6-diaminopimelate ligase [Terasakiispira papahanaumokuakeensis]|uniref:UDP-N-acetylmuramoyl-L-alanyl-D-glutamate--2,6-diaminopimelate ligase n=1 Tax=Terasakiispira papahanaumokuakeensis TaxID=197479 RepID=A0A1E2V7R5_9GAMM|nr:UDP-N-acetylmuramoyl-L-alanyl-D-glutamate--2,6-diaminopimelate ligase [Terasakiispira papahanaumokuakeensis]ODC02695.1 UDP-N-acetylmuramoyl-L-alanyl-D-glutamate--2,6-diaminopimelate ligase [Terasakiispira papahanaumokuakeensis]
MSELTLPQPLTPQHWLTFWAPLGTSMPSGHWPQVSRLVSDSRRIQPGDAFLGLSGVSQNGTDFFDQAVTAGAVLLVSEGHCWQVSQYQGVLHLQLPLLSQRLGDWLAQLTGLASSDLNITAVTGTNGKSSVALYLAQAWQALGYNARVIGTLGRGRPDQLEPTTHTTPDLLTLHRWLAQWLAEGVTHVVMEASSHALDQGRLNGLPVRCGVLTQLSRDHLDYHGSMAAYGEAKARLFLRPELEAAVINQSDRFGQSLMDRLSPSVQRLCYATEHDEPVSVPTDPVDLSIDEAHFHDGGIRAVVRYGQGPTAETGLLEAPLIGAFNLANLLAVLGVLLSEGLALSQALLAMSQLSPVTGRMQRLTRSGAPTVVVDYAHTPDALANALAAVRLHCLGRVWCVFGCGGDRDTGKRAEMGRMAMQYADQVIVTDDNPRTEDPKVIREMILAACLAETDTTDHNTGTMAHRSPGYDQALCHAAALCDEVAPREAALAHVLQQAGPEDWVLVAGKGHEDYQEIRGVRHHFSDIEQIQRLLAGEVHS